MLIGLLVVPFVKVCLLWLSQAVPLTFNIPTAQATTGTHPNNVVNDIEASQDGLYCKVLKFQLLSDSLTSPLMG